MMGYFTVTVDQSCNGGRTVTDRFRWRDDFGVFSNVSLVSVTLGGKSAAGWKFEKVNEASSSWPRASSYITFDSFSGPGISNIGASQKLVFTFTANVISNNARTCELGTYQHCSGNATEMRYFPGVVLRVTK